MEDKEIAKLKVEALKYKSIFGGLMFIGCGIACIGTGTLEPMFVALIVSFVMAS